MLVTLPGRKGVGKLESVADGRCSVSIFYSIQHSETEEFDVGDIGRAFLSPQTRAYVVDQDRMRVGRITDYLQGEDGLVTYEVRFPNGKQGDFSELDLFVRPWNAPEDPAEILAAGGAESQFLHDRRQAAIEPIRALTSAAQGLTAILSAGIDFVPHQVAAVRRVLSDPIQRYLLADEVGLGKTIEAGLIIRQHLIDNPESEVLIATPAPICEQWRHELTNKLRLEQFGEAFECCSHADIARVTRPPDILVVDEAHHLVGQEGAPLALSAERLRQLAQDVPVLLLLSATPPLGEEAKFLALLNLLDPVTHPIGDLEGFRDKLEQRRSIGRLLLSLNPDAPGLVLRQRGAELERSFPNDPVVQDLAPRLIAASKEGSETLPDLCTAVKEHIADSYRIHQRLIRSRRADAQGWEFRPRGPDLTGEPSLSHVRTESDPSEQIETLLLTLEDWRFAAVEALVDDDKQRSRLVFRYRDVLSAIAVGAQATMDWLASAVPIFDGEAEILAALSSQVGALDDLERLDTMVDSTRRLLKTLASEIEHPKIVVFATSVSVSAAFHAALCDGIEGAACFHLAEDGEEEDDIVAQFEATRGSAILTSDRSAEEGLNLSFVDAIVHLDLPLSAARTEQRIGRLDRYGRRQGVIRHRILLPSDDETSPYAAWYDLLALGFLIFHRSISDVQFLLDDFETRAFEALFLEGPAALEGLVAGIRSNIDEERKSQDEQYALDRIALAEEPAETFIQGLEDAEADEAALENGVDQWLVGTLQLKKRPFAWPAEDPFKLGITNQTLIPKLPWQAELGLDDSQAMTWKRRIATRRNSVTLLRPGAPIVDVLERFTRWDDRGTAFITYRCVPDWQDDAWIGFKLCFLIEPNLEIGDLLAPTRAELAASRRAQRYFAQTSHTLFVDINGDRATDPALLAILERPYDGHRKGPGADINLGSRPQLFAEFVEPASFQRICRDVRDTCRRGLAGQPEVAQAITSAKALAQADLQRRQSRLARRRSAGDAMARADIAMIEALIPSISDPAIRLDAIGCFVVGTPQVKAASHG